MAIYQNQETEENKRAKVRLLERKAEEKRQYEEVGGNCFISNEKIV